MRRIDPPVAIVDASVAVKWVIHEPGSEAALALASGGDTLAAPVFLLIEAANALRKRAKAGELDRAQAMEAYHDLLAAPLERVAVDERLVDEALQLALELDHPVQDCLYLALAVRRDARIVTADRKFATAVRANSTHARRMELLGVRSVP